jgi:RNA polymerase sigma-70 factor (ECF subfamily)
MPGVRTETHPHTLGTEALAHVDALYAFAWRLARDPAAADDLVQETFARGIAGSHGFGPGTNLKAWLFRILRNAFLDQRRRAGRNPIQASSEPVDYEVAANDGRDPEQLLHLETQDLDAALAALPEDQRSVVLLDLEGFGEQEIADVMGCAPGTVKSRLFRARAALRAGLWEYAK